MKILSVDTSTITAGIAIVIDDRIICESLFEAHRTLSARLLPEMERLAGNCGYALRDMDLFACARGPGSFTGVRCGVATVQGLSLATGKPCTGFSSLASLAMNFHLAAYPVCTILDARKNEIYGALYDCSSILPQTLIADCVNTPEVFLKKLDAMISGPVIITGDAVLRFTPLILDILGKRAIFPCFQFQAGRPSNGALLGHNLYQTGALCNSSQLMPVYLRPSETEYAKRDRQNPGKSN